MAARKCCFVFPAGRLREFRKPTSSSATLFASWLTANSFRKLIPRINRGLRIPHQTSRFRRHLHISPRIPKKQSSFRHVRKTDGRWGQHVGIHLQTSAHSRRRELAHAHSCAPL